VVVLTDCVALFPGAAEQVALVLAVYGTGAPRSTPEQGAPRRSGSSRCP
jgi:hypothetical protein